MIGYITVICLILLSIYWFKSRTAETFGYSQSGGGAEYSATFKHDDICLRTHTKFGLNHPWFQDFHDGLAVVTWIDPNSRREFEFTDEMWAQHCAFVSHKPTKLFESHVKFYLGPIPRLPPPIYHFRDGTVIPLNRQLIQMEADWFMLTYQRQVADDSAA